MNTPSCFISYSWDGDAHKEWVRKLAEYLVRNGVDVKLDQWDAHPGIDLTNYMETSVEEADFVLLICTPSFRKKTKKRAGGVGYEKIIVTGEIFASIEKDEKFIPILRTGTAKESLPSYLRSRLFLDFRDDDEFIARGEELLRHIHNNPKYPKPPLGKKPDFLSSNTTHKIQQDDSFFAKYLISEMTNYCLGYSKRKYSDGELSSLNIFFGLGVSNSEEDDKKAFIDEILQVIVEDMIEFDAKNLISTKQMRQVRQIMDHDDWEDKVLEFLNKILDNFEELMLTKCAELKKEMIYERMEGMQQYFAGKKERLKTISKAEAKFKEKKWNEGVILLNNLIEN